MKSVFIPEYHKRKEEVVYFLNILKEFYNLELNYENYNGSINFEFYNFDFIDFFKIIRSNFILILYNFIESSISLFINSIYTKFEYEDITYEEASECFQKLYLEYTFLDVFQKDATYRTYERKAFEMVKMTLENRKLNFSIEKISDLSGNINCNIISEIWNKHGINFKSSSKSQDDNGNFSIDTIKNKRNSLAHGMESFKECGGKYTVSDLENYCIEIIKLLDDLLDSVESFILLKGYKNNL